MAALSFLAQAGLAQSTPVRSRPTVTAPSRTDRAFNGKVVAVDKEERTLILGPLTGVPPTLSSNQVFTVSTNTIFLKNRARTTFNVVAVGDEVRFRTRKTPEGKEVLNFLFIGTPQMPIRPGTAVRPGLGTSPAK